MRHAWKAVALAGVIVLAWGLYWMVRARGPGAVPAGPVAVVPAPPTTETHGAATEPTARAGHPEPSTTQALGRPFEALDADYSGTAERRQRRQQLYAELVQRGDALIPDLMAEYRRSPERTMFRHCTVELLGTLNTPAARKALLEIASDPEKASPAVYAAVGFINRSKNGVDVQELLSSANDHVIYRALHALRQLDDPGHKQVVEYTASPHPDIRWAAVGVLGSVLGGAPGTPRVAESLAAVLTVLAQAEDMNGPTVEFWPGSHVLLDNYTPAEMTRDVCIQALTTGPWDNGALLKARETLAGLDRDAVTIALGGRGEPAVRDELDKLAQKPEEDWMNVWAIRAIGQTGDVASVPLLEDLASRTQWSIPAPYLETGKSYPIKSAVRSAKALIEFHNRPKPK